MRTFNTFLNCGVLGEAVPAVVELGYYPETEGENESVTLYSVCVKLRFNCTADYKTHHVLDNLTDAERNNIEEAYLDQLYRVEEG